MFHTLLHGTTGHGSEHGSLPMPAGMGNTAQYPLSPPGSSDTAKHMYTGDKMLKPYFPGAWYLVRSAK